MKPSERIEQIRREILGDKEEVKIYDGEKYVDVPLADADKTAALIPAIIKYLDEVALQGKE